MPCLNYVILIRHRPLMRYNYLIVPLALADPDEDRQQPKPLHLWADLPVPLPDFKPKPIPLVNSAVSTQQALNKRKSSLDYPAEPVETRW